MSSAISQADELDIVARLTKAYRYATDRSPMDQASMWFGFFVKHQSAAHAAFYTGDIETSRRILANPGASKILYGFDNLFDDSVVGMRSPERRVAYATTMRRLLNQLALSIGLDHAQNPFSSEPSKTTDDIEQIETALGFSVYTPTLYPDEFGLETPRGLLNERSIAAMYQTYRITTLTTGSVCEIGGGLGRTAYYARAAGIVDYTLVDIPFTVMSQGYYLMMTLGADIVALPGELHSAPIRILAPEDFFADTRSYDLVVNVDSITEFAKETAERYAAKIGVCTSCMLSINHESNSFRVCDLFAGRNMLRFPHWMRAGYVEELIHVR